MAALAVAPLVCGLLLGLGLSKSAWGYWWSPPVVSRHETWKPTGFALFALFPNSPMRVVDVETRDRKLAIEASICDHRNEWAYAGMCHWGRAFEAIADEPWRGLPQIPVAELQDSLARARGLVQHKFLSEHAASSGLAATFVDDNGRRLEFIGIKTIELSNDNHGYVELVVDPAASKVLDHAFYSFDFAGGEFLTPWLLTAIFSVIAYLITSVGVAVWFFVRLVRRARRAAPG